MTEQIDLAEFTEPFVSPASFAQQRMWFLDQIESGGAAYNVPTVTRLRGHLDVAALERAIDAVVIRHESLRTTFALVDGVPHQVINAPSPFALDVMDLRGETDAEARGLELAMAYARRSFDLSSDRLFHAALIRLGAEDHILSLTLHHIITDAWSVGVVNREIAKLYGAFVEGRAEDLPQLAIQYADYAAWQQQWMESGGLDDQLGYWMRTLAGAPALLELPTDRPRPPEQSFRGETLRTVLPRQLADRVRVLGEREGATTFMTLLTAFATMLSRYSRQDDLVIATPVANRNRVEFEQVTGLLVNTLAIRVELADDPSFAELLRRVRERCLDAFSNQDLPFERLVGELNPERDRSHAPVAQVMFVLQSMAEKPATFPGLQHERVPSDRGTAKFDLALFAGELRDGVRVAIEYCTDLFEASTIERMLEHFEALLAAIVADPECPVSQLDFLPEAERERIMSQWGVAGPTPSLEHCVHELFADQARRTPDAVAVALGGDELTYAELEGRCNRLAWRLHRLGVEPDSVVGVCAERGIDMVVAVLAALKAGAAYAPIDPAYPQERIAFMLADSAVPVLLTQRHLIARLPEHHARTVCVDDDEPPARPDDEIAPPPSGVTPNHLAYVLYTSGSTGQPKGVAMEHRPLANLLAWQQESWTAPAPARTLQFASLSFDVAFQEIFSTWCAGGTVVLVDEGVRRDPEALVALLARERVERLFLPFVALQALCEAAEDLRLTVPNLRDVITAGEQLKVTPPIRRFFARHGRCRLFNHYGPTESHVVTSFALDRLPDEWPELPPIGRPIPGAVIRLLDRHRRPVPIGVPGELCIGGMSLARGYLDRPELTDERFIADPFSEVSGARLYRTGDLARHLPDGNIEFLGRIDHQTKVRGYRIEPGEVEAALREHGAVRDAIVIAVDEGRAGNRLVAYLLADDPVPGPAELHDMAARRLPEYMVPSAFVTLDAFPLTPTGKVDRRALPEPAERDRITSDYVPPRTDLERSLAEIWSELLGVERVGANDNFFSLGGHSLLAVRVVARIRESLGVELALSILFQRPTVTGLAEAVLEGEPAGARAVTARPIPRAPREQRHMDGVAGEVEVLPASYAEARLWFLDRLEPNNAAYNVTLAARLTGPLDRGALNAALDELVRRHESLRTTFRVLDGAPVQVVAPPRSVPIALHDLTGPDADDRAQALTEELTRAGFDLSVGPLLRACLIAVRRDEHILIISLHHIVIDGWSIGIVNRELSALYRAHRTGHRAALPEPAIQYGDFAVWQQAWMRSGGLDEQLDYWTDQLASAPALLELPTDRPRPSRQTFRGGVVRRELPDAILERVRRLGEEEGATLFMTLLAAFVVLLARYSGQEDVVVASPVANRNRVELEGLIGFFVNTLALRVRLDDDPSFRELLASVRETAVGAFSNQDLPFEKLVEVLAPDRQMSFPPVAQVAFALNAVEPPFEFDGLQSARVSGTRRTTKFDLSLYAAERSDGMRLSIEYAADLFDEATAARMLAHYENLLCSALADPSRPVSTLPLLDDDERREALAAGGPAAVDYPVACMHELFERHAAERPAAIAATFTGESVSYGELDRRANRLAHRLRSLGARPGTLVAILLEPSLETLVAILGVLKAGAAYVPLDPEHPDERLAFVVRDTAAPIAVTSAPLLDRLPRDEGLAVVQLDPGDESLLCESTAVPEPLARPEDLAYVIYTSGSTGTPKGVKVEHRNVARLFSATEGWFGPGPGDTWTLLHSYAFDFSVWELWGALAHGGRLVVSPRATTRAPDALVELIDVEGVTVLNATPSLFLAIQEELTRRADRLALRLVIFGGEALHPPALRPWFERFGERGPRLVNMYGITETTVHVTYRPVTAADCAVVASPIGGPIPDLGLYLLDRHGEPVPPGVVGELHVAGAGVAAGYLNRPELTSERFIANPFGPGRLYRSGDLARRLGDGELEFRGRGDDQVKIRGFRIELGEIRAALVAHPAVAEAAVVVSRTGDGEPRLIAYVVPGETIGPPGADELRAFVADSLPAYMLPAAWILLDALPLTRNGKLYVQALPAPEYDRSAAGDAFVEPSTETEQALARIWREVLGVPEVGVNDSFFELGGHSMLAVRLFAEIESALGARLPLSALFEASTIAGLARFIERDRSEDLEFPSLVRLRDGTGPTPLFLVAWAGGEVLPYRDLVESLAPATPVFGLMAPGAGGRGTPLASVEELAEHYVAAIRQAQPQGPYQLGGFCFSGLVAYEMAGRLIDQGERVALLAMLDTYPYKPPRRRSRVEAERVKLKAFREADLRGKQNWLRSRINGLRRRFDDLVYLRLGPRLFELLAARDLQHRLPRRPWNLVLVASNLARQRYLPRPLDVRIEFFRAQTTSAERPTPWDAVAHQGVRVRPVVAPGITHDKMMHEPFIGLLASEFARVIDDAADGGSAGSGAV